jgi:hypothetical protein
MKRERLPTQSYSSGRQQSGRGHQPNHCPQGGISHASPNVGLQNRQYLAAK